MNIRGRSKAEGVGIMERAGTDGEAQNQRLAAIGEIEALRAEGLLARPRDEKQLEDARTAVEQAQAQLRTAIERLGQVSAAASHSRHKRAQAILRLEEVLRQSADPRIDIVEQALKARVTRIRQEPPQMPVDINGRSAFQVDQDELRRQCGVLASGLEALEALRLSGRADIGAALDEIKASCDNAIAHRP